MKKVIVIMVMLITSVIFALDNAAWLDKARECASDGFMVDTDETEEDGVYCLVLSVINTSSRKSVDAQVGEAVLEAKKKITAFVKGEKVSASTSLDAKSKTYSIDDEKIVKKYKKFEKQIKTQINALIHGVKMVGQISVEEKSYVVCVTCERFENHSLLLEKAQLEYGDEGVVISVGEASNLELAKQKAIRGAVEQVLGTVVVGYDKMSTKSEFSNKVFSGTDGVVEKYRILSETDVTIGKRVEIVAKVSKKNLLDNYSNYMKFLGDPAFYIESNSADLASHFTEFFIDMGIRIAPNPDEATYAIFCSGTFRNLKHPIEDDRDGVQLSLRFKVQEINGKETLIDMKNDPRKSACFVGRDTERQKEICANKAFRQMKNPLHEKIQAMIGKLVGRKMSQEAFDDEED